MKNCAGTEVGKFVGRIIKMVEGTERRHGKESRWEYWRGEE